MIGALTKHSPGRDRLPVEPEGHLGQDDGHEARHVGLNHKVANLSLQEEVSHHYCVLTWGGKEGANQWSQG